MELHGFTEGLRRVFGYSVAGLGHAQQFGLAGAVPFGGGQLAGGLRVAAAEYGKTVTGDGDGFPEVAPVVVFHIIEIDGFKQGLRLRTDAPEAFGEDVFLEFRDDVSGSALNLDVVVDDAAHRDDVEDGLGGLRVPVIAQGLALPVRIDLVAEEHFLLLGDRIRVLRARRHRVQFFVNPVVGQFRADMDSPCGASCIADDEFAGLDGDGLGFAVAFESLGTADDHGFALRFLEYVRLGERAFKTDGGNMGKKLLLELVDSGSQHGGVLCG